MSCPRPDTPRSNPKAMGELSEPLRSRLQTLIDDAPGGGLVLVSGYRDSGRQWDLRHTRCRGQECDRRCRGFPLTAIPGRSNHEHRQAADIGGRNLTWANRSKSQYGLATPVRGEPWHFEVSKLHRPSVTIRAFGGSEPAIHHALTDEPELEEDPLALFNNIQEFKTAVRESVQAELGTVGDPSRDALLELARRAVAEEFATVGSRTRTALVELLRTEIESEAGDLHQALRKLLRDEA